MRAIALELLEVSAGADTLLGHFWGYWEFCSVCT